MFTDHSTLKYLVNKPVLGGEYADGFCYFKNIILRLWLIQEEWTKVLTTCRG
jgi:hypothetical protein